MSQSRPVVYFAAINLSLVATALKELPEPERDKAEHDLNTPRGVTAFLVWIAREYPQVACAMLARMMPQQKPRNTARPSD
jgi:hypothetical protein